MEHYMRPTFGGGSRPTQGRMAPVGYGLFGLHSEFSNISYLTPQYGICYAGNYNSSSGSTSTSGSPGWMKTAMGEIGVSELKGMHSANPRIMEYFKASKYWGKDDTGAKNAWCGSFVAWVMKKNNFTPVNFAFRAKAWTAFGKTIAKPVYGAIGIKSRTGGGHVAFVVGQNKDGSKYYMLGGNQSNKVQISEYLKTEWTTFVVPANYDETQGELPVYKDNAVKAGSES